MPFGDGTGPRGTGPMTGRGAGYCIGVIRPGFTTPVFAGWFGFNRGSGRGAGRGRGRGLFRRGFSPFASYPRR
jgi:hypothetical protein